MLATNEGDGTVVAAFNNGTGSFGTIITTAVGSLPHDAVLADIDKDGDLDFMVSSQSSATTLAIGLNSGTGRFTVSFSPVGSVSSFSLADIDADGDFDLLTLDQTVRTVRTWLNNGAGTFNRAPANRITPLPATFLMGDLDGDGDIDWLTANSTGTLSPRFNTGTALATQPNRNSPTLAIYPNPARQHVTVAMPIGIASTQFALITLINALGQEVLRYHNPTPTADSKLELDISNIVPGIYRLRLIAENINVSKALIIE